MGTLTNHGKELLSDGSEHRRKEIRAIAVQAAATFYANRSIKGSNLHELLNKAREIERFIDEGRIPEVDDD